MAQRKFEIETALEDWYEIAACRFYDTDLFFSEPRTMETVCGKLVCISCPVRNKCIPFSLDEKYGLWGGLTRLERRRIKRVIEQGKPITPEIQKIDKVTLRMARKMELI